MKPQSRIRIMYRNRRCLDPLFYTGKAHGTLIAPARKGKFTCVLAQMLMSGGGTDASGAVLPRSILSVDPKGQACAVTHRHLKKLGRKVYRLDPFNLMARCRASRNARLWRVSILWGGSIRSR